MEETVESRINGTLTVYRVYGKYILDTANSNYSYGGLHRGFQKAFRAVNLEKKKFSKVLLLGFGAGSVVSILQEEMKRNCHITAVELDPSVIILGEKYFNTGRFRNLTVKLDDAAKFVSGCKEQFDLIAFDIYIDNDVPSHLENEAFLKQMKALLSNRGMLVYNKNLHSHEMLKQLPGFLEIFNKTFPGSLQIRLSRKSLFLYYSA